MDQSSRLRRELLEGYYPPVIISEALQVIC